MSSRDLSKAHEFVSDRLYYVALRSAPRDSERAHFFSIDDELVYWNFFLDFGPLNLGQLYRFCEKLTAKLRSRKLSNKRIYFYSSTHPHRRANAAMLISAYAMLVLGRSPEDAYAPFRGTYPPFPPFHDASPCVCTFNLTILDCLKGIDKARRYGFFDFERFAIDEYEYFEQVDYGDLNWIVDGKFCAFAGPHNSAEESTEGYSTLTPEHYIDYFHKRNVQLVVRLNKKYYDEGRFTRAGIKHTQLYYLDGSTPPDEILQRFISVCEAEPGAIAVHCKAGLGRTGTTIGCYIMKHYRFTAHEVIGWIRICRPGSIIGPQQHYMKQVEQRMWREGEAYRRARSVPRPPSNPTARDKEAAAAKADDGRRDGSHGHHRHHHGSAMESATKSMASLSLSAAGARAVSGSRYAAGPSTPPSASAAGAAASPPHSGHSGFSGDSGSRGSRHSPLSSGRRTSATVPRRALASSGLSASSALYGAGTRATRPSHAADGGATSATSQGDMLRRARRSPGSPDQRASSSRRGAGSSTVPSREYFR